MRTIFFFSLFVSISFGLPKTVTIIRDGGISVVSAQPWRSAEQVGTLEKGQVRNVLDVFADYYEVQVISGKVLEAATKATNLGINGVMWIGSFVEWKGAQAIIGGTNA